MQLGGRSTVNVGRYRIQAMAAMTGVSAPTLRAWERRYQIPQPQRTASAYRLYTDADVDQVRRMRDLCAAGHSAAQAAALVRQDSVIVAPDVHADPFTTMRETLLQAALHYDEGTMQDTLRQLLTAGPASLLFDEVVAPLMVRVGELWRCGEMSVAQEHLLSQQIETSLRNLLQVVQPVDATRTVLLACAAQEDHTFGLYGVGLRFAGWGYRVVHLGARMPPDGLREAVQHVQPDVVGLSCAANEALDAYPWPNYAEAMRDVPWLVGGGGSETCAPMVTAHGGLVAAPSLDEVRQQLETVRRQRLPR